MTFNSMGGSSVPSQTVYRTYPIRRPADPTRRGHIFTGWYSDEACEHQWDFKTIKNIDMTLYAGWKEGDYLVTFNTNGGSPIPSNQPIKGNGLITEPQDHPTRNGYTFDGWYTDNGSFRNKWNFNTPPASNITLYAKWNFGGSVNDGNNIFEVYTTAQWDAAVTTINSNAGGNYMINIRANFSMNGVTANTFSETNINVHINGNGNTISLNGQGNLLNIASNQTVYMLGLTLKGEGDTANNTSLVYIDGGTFTMESGTITGNNNPDPNWRNPHGGGVFITSSGTFNMNGGTISGNYTRQGGGVQIGVSSSSTSGTFNMTGGTITRNTAEYGGGVAVYGTFKMTGGEISGNETTNGGGGGVILQREGTFTMSGGVISGNKSSGNSDGGGGVLTRGTFEMTGGKISGNEAYKGGGVENGYGTFNMLGGEISGNRASVNGGGVYAGGPSVTFRIMNGTIYGINPVTANSNTATESGAALYLERGTAQSGTFAMAGDPTSGWNGGTDIPLDGGDTTGGRNATIRVVNGVLQ